MPDNSSARSRILASIRMSLGAPGSAESIAAEYGAISRIYTRSSTADDHALLDIFIDRLLEYDAGVYRASGERIAATVAEILAIRTKQRMAIPVGIPEAWLPDGFDFAIADGWSNEQLDGIEGTLSACTVAIAETGTIVLQNSAGQGPRSLSLVPDYFLCVVFSEQVVATVPEAFDRIEATSRLPTTFISGPSATADIEMTRIKGVHGPRFLNVILVS
jgi:L-lactate dehydrogenase complex protein LldG